MRLHRDDAALHAVNPDLPTWVPARWWRHGVMRAAVEVPGVEVQGN